MHQGKRRALCNKDFAIGKNYNTPFDRKFVFVSDFFYMLILIVISISM